MSTDAVTQGYLEPGISRRVTWTLWPPLPAKGVDGALDLIAGPNRRERGRRKTAPQAIGAVVRAPLVSRDGTSSGTGHRPS
jgi:hypothetical protein